MTQSTLSASIKELESVLETTLVDRSKRRVVLTPVGVEAVERARRIVKEVEDLVNFTTALREPLSGTLRMGTIPTIGPFLLPRVLPSLRQAYSRLRLYLVEDLTERLIDSLHRGELDIVTAKRLGGPEIDHEIKLDRLLDRQIGRLVATQDLVDVVGRSAVLLRSGLWTATIRS